MSLPCKPVNFPYHKGEFNKTALYYKSQSSRTLHPSRDERVQIAKRIEWKGKIFQWSTKYIVAMSKEQTGTTSLASATDINVVCASVSRDGRGRRRSRSALRCGVTLEAERVVLR